MYFLKRTVLLLCLCGVAFGQSDADRKKYDKAAADLEKHNLAGAEKLLREVTSHVPEWAAAYVLLGRVYFLEPKTNECLAAYERAHDLDLKQHLLTEEERHEVYNQLGVIYGLSHDYEKSIAILQEGMKDDPNYGEYEYNIACDYSEKGDLDTALEHLKHAWALRATFQFPDVMKDSSFTRWHDDPRFQKVAGTMVM